MVPGRARPFAGRFWQMGLFDTFIDEDSTCPNCKAKVSDWQTKDLDNLMERWKKGDFVQYRKLEIITEEERKQKYPDDKFAPLRRTKQFVSNIPLMSYGKIPVDTSCDDCEAWLEAYAIIQGGRFSGIVKIDVDGKDRDLVLIRSEKSAKELREEFEERLSSLQMSCNHEESKWQILPLSEGPFIGKMRVCVRCEKTLETISGFDEHEKYEIDPNDPFFHPVPRRKTETGKKRKGRARQSRMSDHDKTLYGRP